MEKAPSSLITYADTKVILLMAREMAKALRTTQTATLSIRASGIITFLFAMFNNIKTVAFTKASS